MVVALVGAPDDVSYYCRIRFADGSTSSPRAGRRATAPGSCRSTTAGPTVTAVDVLPDGTEKVWSAASFS